MHKHMEEVMDPEVATTATEEIKEAITINTEVDTKATKTTGNLSIWMTEEIIFGTLMGTRLMHQKSMMQPLLFILQVWKVTKVTEAEGLQEEEEDPTEDTDQDMGKTKVLTKDMDQVEEQIGEHKEETTTDKDHIEDLEEDRNIIKDLEEDKNLIEDLEEHMTKDKDSTEAQGEVQTKDREVEDLPSLIILIGTAWYARREDTIAYLSAPSFRTIFQEVITSYQSPEKYVNNASQQLANTIPVITHTQEITRIGSVTYTNQISHYARIAKSTKVHKTG